MLRWFKEVGARLRREWVIRRWRRDARCLQDEIVQERVRGDRVVPRRVRRYEEESR